VIVATPKQEDSHLDSRDKLTLHTLSGHYSKDSQDALTQFSLHFPFRTLVLTSAYLDAVAGFTWMTADGTRVLCRNADMFDPSTCDKTVTTVLEKECPNTTTVTDPAILSALKR
jgi:hypothetical protein